ncbi:sigma-70 family RNA polymerase sigma factor [Bacteroides sp. OttesenSCG-928-D19]|nr:sigma-70 family RNA polymerase sigma factor [Bacteroides sp. OttesenSCG-928-D19]
MKLQEFKQDILPLRDKLFRIALRITCNKEEAEDIVQDIMMKMWQMRDEWHNIQSKDAYCCMMARNTALGRIELKDNQNQRMEPGVVEPKDDTSPLHILEQTEIRGLVRQMIARLPNNEKSVMELRDLESMSYKEIAETLEMSDAQVKSNLFRARKKIKELFARIA